MVLANVTAWSDPATNPTTIAQYSTDLFHNDLVQYSALASITMLAWDWLTSLDEEVMYIWTIKSSMGGKYLYLFFRYAGTAFEVYNAWQELGDHGTKFCDWFYALLPIGTLVLLFTADALLSYRALCLWRMNRKLLIANCTLFASAIVTSAILLGFAVSEFTIVPTLAYSTGCFASTPIFTALAPIPGLLFEIWIFAMVLARLIMFSKSKRFKQSASQTVDILQLLVHDAMWWFTFISFLLVLNAVFFAVGPEGATGFFLPFLRAFIVVMGSRLIVRMRKAHLHNEAGGLLRSRSQPGGGDADPNYDDRGDKSVAGSRTLEANRVGQALNIARRVGLPPALPADLDAFWDDPIRTINHAVTSDELLASGSGSGAHYNVEGAGQPDIGLELHPLPMGRATPSRRTSLSSLDDEEKRTGGAGGASDGSYVERMWRTDTTESFDPYDAEDVKTLGLFVAPMARKPDSTGLASSVRHSVVVEEEDDRDPTPTPTQTGRPMMVTASSSSSRHLF